MFAKIRDKYNNPIKLSKGKMEEINSLILYGCKLARDLELNLQNLSNQPNKMISSCDEIARVFTVLRDRLNTTLYDPPVMRKIAGGDVPEWQRYGETQGMGSFLQSQSTFQGLTENKVEISHDLIGGGGVEQYISGGVTAELARDEVDLQRSGSSQRPRRRKDEVERRRIRVPVTRMGNTEIPPEDGHTWRKYGQKEILGSRFPRSYYRCTHQKMYQCPAKKQVQRFNEDPFTFDVTYRGDHTCIMSSTAPSIISNETFSHQQQTPTLYRWRWMNLNPSGEGTSNVVFEGYKSSHMTEGTSDESSGPSTVRFVPEGDYALQVADLANAMFNTGSGGNNSLDHIFSSAGKKPQNKGD